MFRFVTNVNIVFKRMSSEYLCTKDSNLEAYSLKHLTFNSMIQSSV